MHNALVDLFDAKKIKKEVCVSNNSNNGDEGDGNPVGLGLIYGVAIGIIK